jgi:polyhydroxyalkanoate synthesis regulator phasin
MFETVNRLMLASLGALSMTRERAEKIFDEYVQRGQTERGDREGFVRDVMDTAERGRRELEEMIDRQVQKTVSRLNLATQEDVARLEAKLDQLLVKCGG